MPKDFSVFENKYVKLYNPLPPVTFEELYARAKVRLLKRRQAKRQVFDLELRWGGGEDLETHTLRPGQEITLPESKAVEVIQDFKPSGEICSTNPGLAYYRMPEEKNGAILNALGIAETHYHALGADQLDKLRSSLGHRDDEVEGRFRNSTYATYFLAMAKEELIRETREEIETAPEENRKAG